MKTGIGISALATVTLVIGASITATAQDLSGCLGFQDDKKRLGCYDSAAGFSPENAATDSDGKWIFVEQMDEFTNKNTSALVMKSDAYDDTFSDKPERIVIRCDGNRGTEIYVGTHGYIGSDGIRVRYKFGGESPISERWSSSTNGKAVFLPSEYRDFRKGLKSGQPFLFEVTSFQGTPSSAKFPGSKLTSKNAKFILAGCH